MLEDKRVDPRNPDTVEWGEQVTETKPCAEFANLPGRFGIRTRQFFNDADIDVFVGEAETPLTRILSGNPSPTEFYASGGLAYVIVHEDHDGEDIRADYYPGGAVLTAEVLDSEDFKGPQGDVGPQGPTGPTGPAGDVASIENVGAGAGIFKEIASAVAKFKTLVAGANINFDTTDPDEIEISADTSGDVTVDAINAATEKTTLADSDRIPMTDSAASFVLKWFSFSNLKVALKAYLDTLYPTISQVTKTYITAQATPSRVTSGPSSLGNYRSYLKNASARTYTETNGTPSTAPSSSNGYLLYANATYAAGDSSGQPSRYEIYIGTNKEPVFEFYRNTGRTGFIDVTPFYAFGGGNYDGGIFYGYDPATGIAYVTKAYPSGGTVSAGIDAAGLPIAATIYFDIKC